MVLQPTGHSNFTTPAFVLGGGVNALEVVRSLGRHRIPVALFSDDANDLARRSRYVTSFHRVADNDQEMLPSLFEAGERSADRPVLFFTSDLLLQERIVGNDDDHFSVLIYRSPRFGEVFRLCVNKERVWPIRNGAGSFSRVFPDGRMEEISTELLERLGWVGMASVCFKVDSRTGQPMIHEVNGRLPQIHGIAQAAGIELPFLMYQDAMGEDLRPVPAPSEAATYRIFSMDCAGLLAYRRAGNLTRREVLRHAMQIGAIAEFAGDD
jgi:predicted ATP-grasp superfamily ATP-dependent carboligase